MHSRARLSLFAALALFSCSSPDDTPQGNSGAAPTPAVAAEESTWIDGDTIPSGKSGVSDIRILKVHSNGAGSICGTGRTASLKYKAMRADGSTLDPGNRPFSFQVGSGRAIAGWDVVVSKMRVGDSFTI